MISCKSFEHMLISITEQAIWRKFSVTQKLNFPFSWVFRSKNSNFSPVFFLLKQTSVSKRMDSDSLTRNFLLLINNITNLKSHTGCGGSASCNVFNVPVHNSCFSMLLFSNLIYSTPLLLKERKCSWKSRVSHLLLE